jgi:CxxC motif-containing protein
MAPYTWRANINVKCDKLFSFLKVEMEDKNKISKIKVRCITCPVGCTMEVITDKMDGSILEITGNECAKGIKFAKEEITNPVRILTTTVSINSSNFSRLPVRSLEPVPKNLVKDIISELRKIKISPPVKMGQVIGQNLSGSKASIIASATINQ